MLPQIGSPSTRAVLTCVWCLLVSAPLNHCIAVVACGATSLDVYQATHDNGEILLVYRIPHAGQYSVQVGKIIVSAWSILGAWVEGRM